VSSVAYINFSQHFTISTHSLVLHQRSQPVHHPLQARTYHPSNRPYIPRAEGRQPAPRHPPAFLMRLVVHPPRLIPHDALSQISTRYVNLVLLCAFPEKGRAVGRIAEMCLCWWRCICSHPARVVQGGVGYGGAFRGEWDGCYWER